jgi:putative ABC transport system permease protein
VYCSLYLLHVIGATVSGIVFMLSKGYLHLIVVAIFIASPLAWYFMEQWLQNFGHRINISIWVFAMAAISTILIALVTVGFQGIKAAIANPVKSLRSE